MKHGELVKLYRNIFEEGTTKGSFFITESGIMTPRTKNVNLWGLTSSSSIPPKYKANPNVVTSVKQQLQDCAPTQLPAFFKFQKNPTSGFSEAVAMEVSTHFNTRTSYNYPAHIDQSENSLYFFAQNQLPEPQSDFGSLVFSFLSKDEELVSFYKMARSQEISTDFMTISSLIPSFVANNLPNLSKDELSQLTTEINRDYAYQYLLRDYLGDIDYTSKNAGIIINKNAGYATLAPNFDYGESMNLLTEAKFKPPKLDKLEDYPENTRQFMSQVIDKINESKLKKYNASPKEMAQQNTFEDKSELNIRFICTTYPDVAEAFRQDLQAFISSGQLPQIMGQYAGKDGLVTPEQADMCVEYLEERGAIFENKLTTHLEKVVPDYTSLREQSSTELYSPAPLRTTITLNNYLSEEEPALEFDVIEVPDAPASDSLIVSGTDTLEQVLGDNHAETPMQDNSQTDTHLPKLEPVIPEDSLEIQ